MKRNAYLVVILLLATVVFYVACLNDKGSEAALPDKVSYNFHIRPILSDKCFKCHGPDVTKQEGGLRLDIAENAYAPLRETKGAFAIVPGKPEKSEMFKRISSTDSSYQMPTPESHLGLLSAHEIKLVEKWIRQGAKYERHWAFIKPEKAPVPTIDDKKWAVNEIDAFIAKRQEEQGIRHNEEADKEHLLKRVALDLTGLPPAPEMIDRFIADQSPQAYEKMVDALLATPQYGEKM
ncbi:MAG TPA: DUF1549 domain-containing protein, partial [Flavitalea sp.]|nr:DUF1549 domain-containing protein [Flavitalea sp.]